MFQFNFCNIVIGNNKITYLKKVKKRCQVRATCTTQLFSVQKVCVIILQKNFYE